MMVHLPFKETVRNCLYVYNICQYVYIFVCYYVLGDVNKREHSEPKAVRLDTVTEQFIYLNPCRARLP